MSPRNNRPVRTMEGKWKEKIARSSRKNSKVSSPQKTCSKEGTVSEKLEKKQTDKRGRTSAGMQRAVSASSLIAQHGSSIH